MVRRGRKTFTSVRSDPRLHFFVDMIVSYSQGGEDVSYLCDKSSFNSLKSLGTELQ